MHGFAVKRAAIFDPQSETWRDVATQRNPRTYHNTAVLSVGAALTIAGGAGSCAS